MVRTLPFLISLVLSVYALFSCIQTRDEDVPHLPKLVWIVLIVFVPFVGPITWLLLSRRAAAASERRPARPAGTKPPARPVAPDDDPDFLASLERFRDPRMGPTPDVPDADAPATDAASGEQPKPEDKKKPRDKKKAKDSETEAPTDSDDGKA
ncbi:phospholipase D-like protein [Kribbella sp. VKM Ac-2527]|uniref:Phospholipase D-like protein n=1 Tax=Kribbella caucasensis TaxID=2512215 RepID=A0A4R6JCK6_9ACTN|nr:PLD nuclease N-terminal domain-containing protein [Kribbella sp. VKM Ac-2527]TDO33504.1 phospholipase D-like protein [Kribbella sp. VKM Ac-2527]